MFSPKLYRVNKLPLKYIINNDFNVEVKDEKNNLFTVSQQDNMLFRQIRITTNDNNSKYIPWVIFVNCSGCKSNEEGMREIITEGFFFNGRHYVISERSASMVRQSMLSFIDSRIAVEIEERVSMELNVGETVLSKWYAYRGLLLSSCHCLEGWRPKAIVVPDRYAVIKEQRIKYVVDTETEFIDKEGNNRTWKQKDITEGIKDIEINLFDGCGIHHPILSEELYERLSPLGDMRGAYPTSILIRAPFIKGMSHAIDYERFFAEHGIEFIKDIWGTMHDVRPGATPMMIMTESMYKGYKYFKIHDDYRDWEHYWDMFDKYNHVWGIVQCNSSLEDEEVYRRGNYQILQDLELDYRSFRSLANYSVEWAESIASGDWRYVSCFLGLLRDRFVASTNYIGAVLKNPAMVHEKGVRKFLAKSLEKYIDEMKAGKLYIKATSKYLAPDIIMLLEHIADLPLNGCLESNELWTRNMKGTYSGDLLIERNPHICKSEHVILNAVSNELIETYIGHLTNVCMVNCKSLVAQRLNGADVDGDLVLVVDDETMKSGVDINASIVIDIEDKATAIAQEDTNENRLNVIMLSMLSLIGEASNCATTYHNKVPQTVHQKKVYERYIDLLCVVVGKAIDAAKTGVIFRIPPYIAKYGKPIPYFMKYAGSHYSKMKDFLKSRSNMNRLCWELEKYHSNLRWSRRDKGFDYKLMIDCSVDIDDIVLSSIEGIYLDYNKQLLQIKKDELSIQRELGGVDTFKYNWDSFYEEYRNKCFSVCPDKRMLVNALVIICYERYPKGTTGFLWNIAGDYIPKNIKQTEIELPIRDEQHGEFEYLGKGYRMECLSKLNSMDEEA